MSTKSCKTCKNRGWTTLSAVAECNVCENFEFYKESEEMKKEVRLAWCPDGITCEHKDEVGFCRKPEGYCNHQIIEETAEEVEQAPLGMTPNNVTVRWFDGYLEGFQATEVRFGCAILWMRLTNGKERIIPLSQVRWFSQSKESHQQGAKHG